MNLLENYLLLKQKMLHYALCEIFVTIIFEAITLICLSGMNTSYSSKHNYA